jgi:hypothetical protein
MKVVFYHNEQQRKQAMASKIALQNTTGSIVRTEIAPIRSFTMAEDYHQKFTLKRHNGFTNEMTRIYPRHQDFVDSTAAARLNGYLGGHGSRDQLLKEIVSLGLSPEAEKMLTDMIRR